MKDSLYGLGEKKSVLLFCEFGNTPISLEHLQPAPYFTPIWSEKLSNEKKTLLYKWSNVLCFVHYSIL